MSGDGTIKIFAGSASKEFAAQMCDYLGSPMGKCTTHIFSEGNTFVRIDESIRDKDVYFVQTLGLDPNNEFTELLFFLDAFKRASANSVTAIIPYFSYAKGDKKDEPRVSIRGRVCAEYRDGRWYTAGMGGEVDHGRALCEGGGSEVENLTLRCKSCHKKRDDARRAANR